VLAAAGLSGDTALVRQVDRLVASCLTRDAARRPTAAALAGAAAAAIRAAEPPAPVAPAAEAPAPVPMWQRPGAVQVQSWLERQWLLITAVSAALVLLALAIAVSPLFRPAPSDTTHSVQPASEPGVHHIDVFSGRATVTVNGKPLGETPVDYLGKVGETVKVELRQPGFEPLREEIQIMTTGTSTFSMRRTGEVP
jgi:hypothetical protein